jgi:hypothetical protein
MLAFNPRPIIKFLVVGLFLCAPNLNVRAEEPAPSDDVIVIDESPDETHEGSQRKSVLEDIKEHAYIRTDIYMRGGYQLISPVERPVRLMGSLWAAGGLEPSDYLSLQLSVIGRVPVDLTWQAAPGQPVGSVDAFIDLSDTYVKVEHADFAIYLGDLLLPWSSTRAAALTDRLNPTDYRRGRDFQANLIGRIPQWGAMARTSIWGASIEGLYLFNYTPSKGSLVASDQGGVQIARYQGALMSNQTQTGDLLAHDRSLLEAETVIFQTPQLAARIRRPFGDMIDVGINVNWGFNEVTSLQLDPKVSSYLAHRYLEGLDANGAASSAEWPCGANAPYSSRQELDKCMGGRGALSHQRVLGFGADFSMNLGAVVLKGDVLVEPKFNGWGGKTAILVGKDKMYSTELSSLAVAMAVDGEYGDWFTGSVELFNVTWFGVPAGERLLGVESKTSNNDERRAVNRLGLATAIEGTFFKQAVSWRLKGEIGISQPDILASFDARHEWQPIGFYAGAYLNAFAGIEGSPGWFRQNATAFGVYIGHKI